MMEDHVWTRISDEVNIMSDLEQLELLNFDGHDLVSHFTTNEVN